MTIRAQQTKMSIHKLIVDSIYRMLADYGDGTHPMEGCTQMVNFARLAAVVGLKPIRVHQRLRQMLAGAFRDRGNKTTD